MKNILLLLTLIGHMAWSQSADQKLSKAEKKQLVARAKKFKSDPQSLKTFLAEYERLKTVERTASERINEAQSEVEVLKENLNNVQSQNESLRSELQASVARPAAPAVEEAPTSGYRLPSNGVVFRVQIGGYKKRDLTEYIDNTSDNIQLEKNQSGIGEITVGQFRDYRKADELKKHLRAMGVKDAWIVPFKDGSRVLLKEVLSEIK